MVHADASNFSTGITKAEAYSQVLEQAASLIDGQRNWVCNLANTASLLYYAFKSMPAPSPAVNWAGFYVVDPPQHGQHEQQEQQKQLILGPFMGKVACQTISLTRGVCGAAARSGKVQIVHDVLAHPNHIACDSDTRSEIVVPVFAGDEVVAVIDCDSAQVGTFDEVDMVFLERLAKLLGDGCDW